jgi:hypothetical protein
LSRPPADQPHHATSAGGAQDASGIEAIDETCSQRYLHAALAAINVRAAGRCSERQVRLSLAATFG